VHLDDYVMLFPAPVQIKSPHKRLPPGCYDYALIFVLDTKACKPEYDTDENYYHAQKHVIQNLLTYRNQGDEEYLIIEARQVAAQAYSIVTDLLREHVQHIELLAKLDVLRMQLEQSESFGECYRLAGDIIDIAARIVTDAGQDPDVVLEKCMWYFNKNIITWKNMDAFKRHDEIGYFALDRNWDETISDIMDFYMTAFQLTLANGSQFKVVNMYVLRIPQR
jgi:hypothetical protein